MTSCTKDPLHSGDRRSSGADPASQSPLWGIWLTVYLCSLSVTTASLSSCQEACGCTVKAWGTPQGQSVCHCERGPVFCPQHCRWEWLWCPVGSVHRFKDSCSRPHLIDFLAPRAALAGKTVRITQIRKLRPTRPLESSLFGVSRVLPTPCGWKGLPRASALYQAPAHLPLHTPAISMCVLG